jgi:pimeloyl-ACP methyl ester carboxylesterase
MPQVTANGITFEYDSFGDPTDPPVLLVMGLGAQMTTWDEEFCEALAQRGLHVVRYDNRDVGLSTRLDHLGVPDVLAIMRGEARPAYGIEDMADDAAALMDAVGLEEAHVVGASMGGCIVQELVIRHPEKVLSLTSIMSGLGGDDMVPPEPAAGAALMAPPPTEREALIEHGVSTSRIIWGDRYFTEERARTKRTAAVDRAVSIEGTKRQLGAVMAQRSRRADLARVRVPALVIHGDADPLVPYENAKRTAEAIPGARLLTMDEVGHDIPPEYFGQVADAIADLVRAAAPSA